MVYVAGAPYVDSDTTFSVKTALIHLKKHEGAEELKARQRTKPFSTTEFDFALRPVAK
jgi:catechol 1,2-dioxygenase/hydroxyquinol 1,2-dioxygenase